MNFYFNSYRIVSKCRHLIYRSVISILKNKFKTNVIFDFRASCPSSLFHTWETFLQEVEADVVGFNNASSSLERMVAVPLIEKTFYMKVQARKLFAHREGCEVILGKADDQLIKVKHTLKIKILMSS